jgi:U3 small nucleolar RNA-associated protein 23
MSSYSAQAKEREERAKYVGCPGVKCGDRNTDGSGRFMDGIIRRPQKRKREEDDSEEEGSGSEGEDGGDRDGQPGETGAEDKAPKTKKKQYGRKGANPLSVKKKQKTEVDQKPRKAAAPLTEGSTETKAKRKRRKKAGGAESGGVEQAGGLGQAETGPFEAAEV